MSQNSAIEWTETTWNPIAGCSKCSPGCARCYALPMANRLKAMGQEKYAGTTHNNGRLQWTGEVKPDEKALKLPKQWVQPRRVFVNSMSDLFHENVPVPFILRAFDAMQHDIGHDRLPVIIGVSDLSLGRNAMTAENTSNLDPAAEFRGEMREAMPTACSPHCSRSAGDSVRARAMKGEHCPECGRSLIPESGCWVCRGCGYSPCG